MNEPSQKASSQKIWVKIGLVVVMSFILMIPTAHIREVIDERQEFGLVAKKEVASKWSGRQEVGAIVLSVPVVQREHRKDDKGNVRTVSEHTVLHFLPKVLNINAHAKNIVRSRGLYNVPLYETHIELSGSFEGVSPEALDMENTTAEWEKAVLSLGVSEVRGLKSVEIKWNESNLIEEVGEMPSGVMSHALNAEIGPDATIAKSGTGRFFIEVTLKGSEALEFFPFGTTTNVSMASNWASPSFDGAYLPESHEIKGENFAAQWKVLGLTRSLPKHWKGTKNYDTEMKNSKFGVNLLMTVQSYQLNTRSVKYALLFILLTFITMFFVEAILKLRFHPMHYGMTGASLILFYLLLLSFSEHIGFGSAYGLASVATVLTITFYVLGVTKVKSGAMIIFTQLGLLYGFLYVLLQQETFTLVFGATGLWVILVILMYATRKVNWFEMSLSKQAGEVQ
jgi:inner membrane protein